MLMIRKHQVLHQKHISDQFWIKTPKSTANRDYLVHWKLFSGFSKYLRSLTIFQNRASSNHRKKYFSKIQTFFFQIFFCQIYWMTRPFRNYWCENVSNPTILKFEPKFPSIKICVKFLQMLIRGKLKKFFTIF